jgi:hypothetical protein
MLPGDFTVSEGHGHPLVLISYIVVARRVAHKVQLHLDLYVCMNMYIKTVYTCCICNVACN